MTKSRVIHVRILTPKQYQMMMSSVARVKCIKTKVTFRYHTRFQISNRRKKVSNRGSDYKLGQGLQIGAEQIRYYTKDLQKTFHLNYNLLNFNKYNRKESQRADDAAFSAACKKVLLIGYRQEINITETCSQEKHRKT